MGSLKQKHCIKQVDRLFSNPKLVVWELFKDWVPYVVGNREEVFVAMDWTDFDSDSHSTIMLSVITGHGRATPLIWSTVEKSKLKDWRNAHEDAVLGGLKETLPSGASSPVSGTSRTTVSDRAWETFTPTHAIAGTGCFW